MLINVLSFTFMGSLIGLAILETTFLLLSVQKSFILQLLINAFQNQLLNKEKLAALCEELQVINPFKEIVNQQINEVMFVFKQRKPMLTFILTPELEDVFKQTAEEIIIKNWPNLQEKLIDKMVNTATFLEIVQEEILKMQLTLVRAKAFKALKNSLRMIAILFGATFGLTAALLWVHFMGIS